MAQQSQHNHLHTFTRRPRIEPVKAVSDYPGDDDDDDDAPAGPTPVPGGLTSLPNPRKPWDHLHNGNTTYVAWAPPGANYAAAVRTNAATGALEVVPGGPDFGDLNAKATRWCAPCAKLDKSVDKKMAKCSREKDGCGVCKNKGFVCRYRPQDVETKGEGEE